MSVLAAGAYQFLDKDGTPDLMLAALRAAIAESGRPQNP
jgi:hypothetical protein